MKYLYITDPTKVNDIRHGISKTKFQDFHAKDDHYVYNEAAHHCGYYDTDEFDSVLLNTIKSLTLEQFVKIMGMISNNTNCDPEIKLPVVVTTDGKYLLLNFYSNDSEWHSSSKLLIEPRIEFYSKVYSIVEEYLENV